MMTKTFAKLGTGIVAGAFLLSTLAPAAFASGGTTVTLSGNGENSTSSVTVKDKVFNTLNQKTKTKVLTSVFQTANSGSNDASSNTGGDVSITTDPATTSTGVDVTGGSNHAPELNCCCNQSGNTMVDISGNGEGSHNNVWINHKCTQKVNQTNKTTVTTTVDQVSNTGDNTAGGNTGGDVAIGTGGATAVVSVSVNGGNNM